MNRKKRWLTTLFCIFALLGNSVAALAQDKQQEKKPARIFVNRDGQAVEVPAGGVWVGEAGQEARVQFSVAGEGALVNGNAPQVQFIQQEFTFDSKVVKGAPYAADAITESVQTMTDGNRITRKSAAKAYRDSAGRTRREQALNTVGAWSVAGDAPVMIYISDPVAGVHYSLDPRTKTATKVNVQRITSGSGDNVVITNGAGGGGGGGRVAVRGAGNGEQVRFVTDDNRTVVLSGETQRAVEEVKAARTLEEVKAAAGGVSTWTSAGTGAVTVFGGGDANRESLGAQTIEGVQAEGSRVTLTIPAGKIGNERPIVTTSERWYSPELQAVVMSKTSDPRSGETTYRLTNLVRSEADASLFQVPADYTIKESTFNFNRQATEILNKIEAEKKARKPNDN